MLGRNSQYRRTVPLLVSLSTTEVDNCSVFTGIADPTRSSSHCRRQSFSDRSRFGCVQERTVTATTVTFRRPPTSSFDLQRSVLRRPLQGKGPFQALTLTRNLPEQDCQQVASSCLDSEGPLSGDSNRVSYDKTDLRVAG